MDFSHSRCKAWSTINKLLGTSGRSSRLCLVSAKSIVSQLWRNGAHNGREARIHQDWDACIHQDLEARIRQTCQHESVSLVEGSKTSGKQYL